MSKIICFLFVFSTLIYSQYYVSENGNDIWPGSSDLPFKSLTKALSVVNDNGYIYVEYVLNGALLVEDQMDISRNNIHIIGGYNIESGEVIGKSNLQAKPSYLEKRFIEAQNIQSLEISNFYFDMNYQPYLTIWIEKCSGITINNCYFKNNRLDAILLKGTSNSKVIYDTVDVITTSSVVNSIGLEGFIEVATGIHYPCNNNQVMYNVIYTNHTHYGINLINAGNVNRGDYNNNNVIAYNKIDDCFSGIMLDMQMNVEVFNNIITNSDNYGIQIANTNDNDKRFRYVMGESKIYNNTIYGSTESGLYVHYGYKFNFINNLLYNNGKADNLIDTKYQIVLKDRESEGDYEFFNNLYFIDNEANLRFSINDDSNINWSTMEEGTAYLYKNPELVNPSALDFHLTNSSFAAARGYNLRTMPGYILKDIEGNNRPLGFGYDIGAYEINDNSVNYLLEIARIPRTISPSSTTNIKNNNRYIVIDNSFNTNHVFESGGEIFYKKNALVIHLSEGYLRGNTNPCITEYDGNIYVVWQRHLGNSNTAIMFSYSNNAGVSWTPYVLTTVYNNTDPNPVIESKVSNTLIVFSDAGLRSFFTNVPSPNVNSWLPNYCNYHLINNPTLSENNGSFIVAYTSNNISGIIHMILFIMKDKNYLHFR